MPEVFRVYGYSFFFYSREHYPIHIHVEGKGGFAKFDWDGRSFVLKEQCRIKSGDLRKIAEVIENTQLLTSSLNIELINISSLFVLLEKFILLIEKFSCRQLFI